MSELPTYDNHLYRSFKAIESDSYRSILRFIENHSAELGQLPLRQYFDLQYAYIAALCETGAYDRVVEASTELLELSIQHNITSLDGEDVYRTLLYRRANGLFHLMRFGESLIVCDQLLRLYPDYSLARHLMERTLYQRPNRCISRLRATSVVLFLIAAALIAIEMLVIVNFLPEQTEEVMFARNLSFVGGWTLLLGGDILHRSWAWLRTSNARRRYKKRREGRGL